MVGNYQVPLDSSPGEISPANPIDWKRVSCALLDSANAAQDGDGYQVAAEVRATWVHYVKDANDH